MNVQLNGFIMDDMGFEKNKNTTDNNFLSHHNEKTMENSITAPEIPKLNGGFLFNQNPIEENSLSSTSSSESGGLVIDQIDEEEEIEHENDSRLKGNHRDHVITDESYTLNDTLKTSPPGSKNQKNSDSCIFSNTLKRKLSVHNYEYPESDITDCQPGYENGGTPKRRAFSPSETRNSEGVNCNEMLAQSFNNVNSFAHSKTNDVKQFLKYQVKINTMGKMFNSNNQQLPDEQLSKDYAQYLGLQPAVRFKCFKCSESNFMSLGELKEHQVICMSSSNFSSNLLHKDELARSEEQNSHRSDKQNNSQNIKQISSANSLTNGLHKLKEDPSTKIRITRKVFLCSACGTYYENWNLFLHMREVHKRHICLLCLGMFPSAERLVHHLEGRHNLSEVHYETKEQLIKLYKNPCYLMCCICEHIFTEHDHFTSHQCENYLEPCTLCGCKGTHNANCKGAVNTAAVNKSKSNNRQWKSNSTSSNYKNSNTKKKQLEISNNKSMIIFSDNQYNPTQQQQQQQQQQQMNYINEKISQTETAISEKQTQINNTEILSKILDETLLSDKIIHDDSNREKETTSQIALESLDSVTINNGTIDLKLENFSKTEELPPDKPLLVPKLKVRIPKEFCTPIESEESSTESDDEMDVTNKSTDHEDDDELLECEKTDNSEKIKSEPDDNKECTENMSNNLQDNTVNEKSDVQDIKEESLSPCDELVVADEDVQLFELSLDQPLDKISIKEFLKICLKSTIPFCLYCNHARKIAVNGKNLALHMIAQHRFSATVDSITAEELLPNTIVMRLKNCCDELKDIYFNLDSYDSSEKNSVMEYEKLFECFQCRFNSKIHKEIYLHNRKLHMKAILLCLMCKSTFYSYSELLCHMCPGITSRSLIFDITFRCCLCNLDNIPSAFRLMVHLRKKHSACDVCLEECYDQSRLSNHVWKHKLHHLCYRCGIAYRNKPDITKHLFWKHGTESVLCKRCLQKKWPHVYHFCIPPATFVCEICNLVFSKAVALRVHKRLHSGDSPYLCTEENCDNKFISRKLLAKHVAKHSMFIPDVNPFERTIDLNEIVKKEIEQSLPLEIEEKEIKEEGKKQKKKKIKTKDNENLENIIDMMDLPAPNLSESDSSDDSDFDKNIKETIIPPIETTEISTEQVDMTFIEDEIKPAPIPDIWDNFKTYQATQTQMKTDNDDDDNDLLPLPPPILHVSQSDHDYCLMFKPLHNLIKKESQEELEIKNEDNLGTVEKIESSPKKYDRKPVNSDSSSSDSSSSDSSCTCGSNCSCSSSSSGSSSSGSSSDDSDSSSSEGRKRIAAKKEQKHQRNRIKNEKANLSDIIDVVATDKPITGDVPDCILYESDLETEESETDEDFYDENPQKIAIELLAIKRKQLMMQTSMNSLNNYTIVDNSRPSTPSLPEQVIKEKKVKVKKRKKDRKSAKHSAGMVPPLKLNIPNTNATLDLKPKIIETLTVPPITISRPSSEPLRIATPPITAAVNLSSTVVKPASVATTKARLSTGSSSTLSEADLPVKRSKRRRIPNRFYGYSSDEEINTFKPTPPPILTWRKEDLPSPTAVKTPPSIKTSIKSPSIIIKPPIPEYSRTSPSLNQQNTPPSIPPIIIRPPPVVAQQPPRVEPLRLPVPSVPVHHITPPGKESEKSDSSDSDSSDEGGLQIFQQPSLSRPKNEFLLPSTLLNPNPLQSAMSQSTVGISSAILNFPSTFQAGQIRFPIMPPAGSRPAREGESVYCYCRCPYDEVSEMIACDGSNCAIEWFHFECVGIMVPPKGKWYCPDCRPKQIAIDHELNDTHSESTQ